MMLLHPPWRGYINQSDNTKHRIETKTHGIAGGLLRLPLQQIIYNNNRLINIAEKIADTGAYRRGDIVFIVLRNRLDQLAVKRVIEPVDHTVHSFKWIVGFFIGRGYCAGL